MKRKIKYVYLTSHSHSGSTLIGFVLNSHSEIASVGELTGPTFNYVKPGRYICSCGKPIQEDPFWIEVSEIARNEDISLELTGFLHTAFYFGKHKIIRKSLTGSLRSDFLEEIRDKVIGLWPGYKHLINARLKRNEILVNAILSVTNKPVFLDTSKDPMRIRYLNHSDTFDLYTIHLLRDIRGVVASYLRVHPEKSVKQAIGSWAWRERNIIRLLNPLPESRKLFVRYEELVHKPLETINNILGFIGVQQWKEMVDFSVFEHHIMGNSRRINMSTEFKADQRWNKELSQGQLATIEKVVGKSNLEEIAFDKKRLSCDPS